MKKFSCSWCGWLRKRWKTSGCTKAAAADSWGSPKGLTGKNGSTISVEKSDAEVDENGTVTKGHAAFTLKVSVCCDANIPETIENLREAVVKEVVKITDFVVDKVDIIVARLDEPAKEAEPVAKAEETEKNGGQHGEPVSFSLTIA